MAWVKGALYISCTEQIVSILMTLEEKVSKCCNITINGFESWQLIHQRRMVTFENKQHGAFPKGTFNILIGKRWCSIIFGRNVPESGILLKTIFIVFFRTNYYSKYFFFTWCHHKRYFFSHGVITKDIFFHMVSSQKIFFHVVSSQSLYLFVISPVPMLFPILRSGNKNIPSLATLQ